MICRKEADMADIFRKKSLDKLSSPEQLDKLIIINSPMTWLALLGGAFMILAALLWGILGRVPMTEEGTGILLREGKVSSVYAGTQGVVTKVNVSSGDIVEAGDLLYEVSSQETALLVQGIRERIKKVEAVTYTSKQDVITSDNQTLVNLKNQKMELPLERAAYEKQVKELEERIAGKKTELSGLKQELDHAESAYYSRLSESEDASIQYEFETASAEYNAAETMFQAADKEYQTARDAADSYEQAWSGAKDLYETAKQSGSAQDAAAAAQKRKEAKEAYDRARAKADSAAQKKREAETERDTTKSAYETKKAAYEQYVRNAGQASAQKTRDSNAYNRALSNYNTAKAELKSLETEIASVQLQLSAKDHSGKVQEKSLKKQFASAKEAILDQLNRELENYSMLLAGQEIKATVDGVVYSTFVSNGSTVTVDMEVARISESGDGKKLQAVYFMQLQEGKKVEEGMEVNVYPSTFPKEEYGHMSGTVVKVADYVTSYADLYARVGDTTLAQTFSGTGAVLEIVCRLEEDEHTKSGYAWSSRKGTDAQLQEGTLLGGSIVTRKVAPITMLIPKLKETFHLE